MISIFGKAFSSVLSGISRSQKKNPIGSIMWMDHQVGFHWNEM